MNTVISVGPLRYDTSCDRLSVTDISPTL